MLLAAQRKFARDTSSPPLTRIIMASPLVGRSPTCLSCIRRINQVGSASISLTQVRGKKTEGRLKNAGVVVRLLKDVEKFGKEGKSTKHFAGTLLLVLKESPDHFVLLYLGTIFRTRPGIMRNSLYSTNKAEYMTRERFKELGLSPNDIGERDARFGTERQQEVEEVLPEDAIEHVAGFDAEAPAAPVPAMEVEQLAVSLTLQLKYSTIFWATWLTLGCSTAEPRP